METETMYTHAQESILGGLERDFDRSFLRAQAVSLPSDDRDAEIIQEETANTWVICRDLVRAYDSIQEPRKEIARRMIDAKVQTLRGKTPEDRLRASTRAYVLDLAYRRMR